MLVHTMSPAPQFAVSLMMHRLADQSQEISEHALLLSAAEQNQADSSPLPLHLHV